MNLNISASINVFKLLVNPSLCLPHVSVSTFNELPVPLDDGLKRAGRTVDIKAVVLDKDDCFAYPESNEVYAPYKAKFEALRAAYPGRQLLIVSNTAGAMTYDRKGDLASELERATGVTVLAHQSKKPGCKEEIMDYFRSHPETGVTRPHEVAVVGDRLTTDVMMANLMGSWGFWIKDGVVPLHRKSIFARMEHRAASLLLSRGYTAPEPANPFE